MKRTEKPKKNFKHEKKDASVSNGSGPAAKVGKIVFKKGQAVDLVIGEKSPLGYTVRIGDYGEGMLYHTEIFEKLSKNQQIKGYIKKIRDDGKIDLCMQKPGYAKIPEIGEQIIQEIARQGGFLAVTDNSSAEAIYELFGISKKNFKKAIGALYKNRRIVLEKDGISLAIK
jgi:predicted RNA-binding protein (virulence factor B family)